MTKKTNRADNDLDAALAALHERLDAEFADIPAPTPGLTDFDAATRHDQFAPCDDRPISAIAADLENHADTLALANEYAREMFLVLEIHKLHESVESGQRRLLKLCNALYALPHVKAGLDDLRRRQNPERFEVPLLDDIG